MPTILVLSEDNEQKIEMTLNLQKLGCSVIHAQNSYDALDTIDSIFPDVLITDLFLPSLDGIGIILELTISNPDLPVIIVGEAKNAAYLKFAERMGASQVLCKPVNSLELEFVISHITMNDY